MRVKFFALLFVLLGLASTANGGPLVVVGAQWQTFSFDPEDGGISPNYYGLGPRLTLGFSVNQIFDLAIYGNYVSATLENNNTTDEDAMLIDYGAEMALRLGGAVYFALRAGLREYHLVHQKRDDELDGRWLGKSYGTSLGAFFGVSKNSFWQVSLDFSRSIMEPRGDPAKDSVEDPNAYQKLDAFSVCLAYVFNSKDNSIKFGFFDKFINSI